MRVIVVLTIASAVLFTFACAIPQGNVGSNSNISAKEFYYTANSVNFAEAKDHCRQSGYDSLAYIESQDDIMSIRELLDGAKVAKLWVAGSPDGGDNCEQRQLFNASCWVWGDDPNKPIGREFWHKAVFENARKQAPEHRAIFRVTSRKLDFELDTSLNQYICQRSVDDITIGKKPLPDKNATSCICYRN